MRPVVGKPIAPNALGGISGISGMGGCKGANWLDWLDWPQFTLTQRRERELDARKKKHIESSSSLGCYRLLGEKPV